jgi:hypothetical protein
MKISRKQGIVAVAAAVLAVAVQCSQDRGHEENVSNPQRLRDISTEIIRHGGRCSDPKKGVVFVRNGVVGYSGIDFYNFSLGLGETGEVIGSEGRGDAFDGVASLLPPREIPKFLSRAAAATQDLCPNTLSPSPNNTRPVGPSGSVALGFFENQGNTIG